MNAPLANHVGLILCMTRKYSVKNGLCEARMVWGRGRGGYLFFSAGHKVVYIHRVFEPPTCPSAKSLRLGRTFHFCKLLSKTPLLLLLVFFIYCVTRSALDSTFVINCMHKFIERIHLKHTRRASLLKSFIFASSYDFSSENRALCFDAL